jgi:pyruvate kinase
MEEHSRYIRMAREAAFRLGNNVSILVDLPGPKYRTGEIKNNSALLRNGSEVILTSRSVVGDEKVIPINFPSLSRDVRVGSKILVDDGEMVLRVRSIRDEDVVTRVVSGGIVTRGRGVVVPGVRVSEPFLTPALRESLDFAIREKADYIALSFVNEPAEVMQVRDILSKNRSDIPIISKIERGEAVKNFDKILAVSEGVMVARGDLGVEIPLPEVPLVQKEIIRKCNKAGKTVITATQMLESMINSSSPTRAEVTDIANAIMDGTDAVMLSAETSIGKYPVQAVKMMCSIAQETERRLPYEAMLNQRGRWLEHQTDEMISYNACYNAYWLKAAAIVAFTQSGSTARRVSKYRPRVPIIAITPVQDVIGRLVLYWDVYPFKVAAPLSMDDYFEQGARLVKELGLARSGDLIIITGGVPVGVPGTTNMLKVHKIA